MNRLPGLDRSAGRRLLAATASASAGELGAMGLLATGAWLLLSASLRPPILQLSVAIGAVQLFSLVRAFARYGERLASHSLGLGVQAGLRIWLYRRLASLLPAGLPAGNQGDLLARLISDTEEVQDLVVRAAVPLLAAVAAWVVGAITAAALLPAAGGGRAGRRRPGPDRHRGRGGRGQPAGGGPAGCAGRRRHLDPPVAGQRRGTGGPGRGRLGPGRARPPGAGTRRPDPGGGRGRGAGPGRRHPGRRRGGGRGRLGGGARPGRRANRPGRTRRAGLPGAERGRDSAGPARRGRPPAGEPGLGRSAWRTWATGPAPSAPGTCGAILATRLISA